MGGEPGFRPGAVTHWFPPPWPPVLFPPRLQRLDLVKRLGCTDLNSSYSPQKTHALASQRSSHILSPQQVCKRSFLYMEKLCFKKKKSYRISSLIPRSRTARNNDSGFSFGRVTCCD